MTTSQMMLLGGIAGDPSYANVSCLLHMNGANGGTSFIDNGPSALTVTASNAQTSTAQSKFNGSSGNPTSTAGALTFSSDAGFAFPGDFTIEMWLYLTTLASCDLFCTGNTSSTTTASFFYNGATNSLQLANSSATIVSSAASPITAATWTYVALTRSGSTNTIFVGAVQSGSTGSDSTSWTNTGGTKVFRDGVSAVGTTRTDMYMAEFRVTKGVARSITTIPTAPFPNS